MPIRSRSYATSSTSELAVSVQLPLNSMFFCHAEVLSHVFFSRHSASMQPLYSCHFKLRSSGLWTYSITSWSYLWRLFLALQSPSVLHGLRVLLNRIEATLAHKCWLSKVLLWALHTKTVWSLAPVAVPCRFHPAGIERLISDLSQNIIFNLHVSVLLEYEQQVQLVYQNTLALCAVLQNVPCITGKHL